MRNPHDSIVQSARCDWQRVSRAHPCPICTKPDWCLFAGPAHAPTAAICARIESPKRAGDGGWLHVLRDDGHGWHPGRRPIQVTSPAAIAAGPIDFAGLAQECRAAIRAEALERFAHFLGLSVASLRRLGIGWSRQYSAWSFPMANAQGQVVGIRLRRPDGRKLSVKGGREGLYIPEPLYSAGDFLICEGPTDTAALLDMGLAAVGRPSCTGGVRHVTDLVRRLAVPSVVIVADGDAPGRRGAASLASVLRVYCHAVRLITPPAGIKDAREWKRRGATSADLQRAIDASPIRRLAIQVVGIHSRGR